MSMRPLRANAGAVIASSSGTTRAGAVRGQAGRKPACSGVILAPRSEELADLVPGVHVQG
jgi:hypothetical protein